METNKLAHKQTCTHRTCTWTFSHHHVKGIRQDGGFDAGGVGPTIMETSYLLAGTPVIAYADGKQVQAKPISQPLTVDFGKGLGRKTVWLYNLPEVESAFKYMKVPNVSARFGTDPGELKGA